ncbi:MAG TPA: FtsK/SpoIIIE domain-containing protein [Planctomicrobium sp.]|nr:FtsK/SpoIIIE domain-containing protein [Planctomicrobium sp.]
MIDLPFVLNSFQLAIERRRHAETQLAELQQGLDQEETTRRQRLDVLLEKQNQALATLQSKYDSTLASVTNHFQSQLEAIDLSHHQRLKEIVETARREQEQLERQKEDSTWVVSSILDDTAEDSPAREYERFKALLLKSREEQSSEWTALKETVSQLFTERGWTGTATPITEQPSREREVLAARFNNAASATRASVRQLNSLLIPQLFAGLRIIPVALFFLVIMASPVFFFVDPQLAGVTGERFQTSWIVISAVAGAMGSVLLSIILFSLGSMRQSEVMSQIQSHLAETEWAHLHWLKLAKEQAIQRQKEFESQQKLIERDRTKSLQRYESTHRDLKVQIEQERETQLAAEKASYQALHASVIAEQQAEVEQLNRSHLQNQQAIQQQGVGEITARQEELDRYASEQRRTRQEQWARLRSEWTQAYQSLDDSIRQELEHDRKQFPAWSDLADSTWTPQSQIPDRIRLGSHHLDLANWEGALSEDARLAPRTSQYAVPALLPFPRAASVLFSSPNAQAREQAIHGLQTLMLRLLTLLPPGKLRFTIIDPVGLGESFGGFMHLADYDELLVTSRIWTEANQIESRLADLTEHMENVLQKYLRNEFQTIEEYNKSAGEVAEPYHFLVISDFPAKFSEIAARRLVSIVNSGPRCGVYTLMNYDPGKQLPNNFTLKDIQSRMTQLVWKDQAFHFTDPSMKNWPVTIDSPPRPEEFTTIVKAVGDASKDARRVEVSFSRITPSADQVWTGDSRSELTIPLGRAGATKLQMLRLGKGTSQHMLVAGKTGSGKSTFLHILITNLALYYGPDEVNFFLIDFKKGVEFKDYATHQLPHAQVIAVESDREFGVSALQRLGDILQERGELFRRHGVQDIAGYRNTTKQPLPRILLVIDEFQEFFIEDDKIGQNAALHLDRLVRQGRAFGIHVILGSQTLGGAYSLARSTMGQVGVRVALQCSEADAHLILNEDNTAARLLTRPGEAIYNDANGMPEGNHPFQIAWITDAQRETALEQMQELIRREQKVVDSPIVFEGNIPSDLRLNRNVSTLIDQYATRESPVLSPTIWLGDAVEIAPPTALTFHRQNGNHILLVGQDAEAAQGVMTAAAVTLVASLSPQQEQNSLFVLDGSHLGTPEADNWGEMTTRFASDMRLVRPNDTGLFLQAMTAELQQREESQQTDAPPLFLFIFNIARFRDLRKVEDDFGMGSFGSSEPKPVEPGKLFADILTRGPAVGMHAVIWCDSNNNVDRWFSRQTLRELEMRIAFQMNASDSSNLIDSPAASRLGNHRALLYREETGTTEKFRPYGVPPREWLKSVYQRMQAKTNNITDLEEFSIS